MGSNTGHAIIGCGKRIILRNICKSFYRNKRMGMEAVYESGNGLGVEKIFGDYLKCW